MKFKEIIRQVQVLYETHNLQFLQIHHIHARFVCLYDIDNFDIYGVATF